MEKFEQMSDFFAARVVGYKEQGLKDDEFFHYDTPCTIDNQIMLLKKAGFKAVEQVLRIENTTILVAKK